MGKRKTDAKAGTSSFVKMKLVPVGEKKVRNAAVRQSTLSRQLEKHIRHADPIVTAMSKSLPYITGLPRKKSKKLGSTASVAVQNAHLERYNNLERLRELSQYAAPPLPQPPPPQPPSSLPPPQSSTDDADVDVVVASVDLPKSYHKKFGQLVSFLEQNPTTVRKTGAGELVLDGRTLRGTSYDAAFRSLYVNTKNPAPGTRELLLRLKQLGVPKRIFSSKYAQSLYGQAGKGRPSSVRSRISGVLRVYK